MFWRVVVFGMMFQFGRRVNAANDDNVNGHGCNSNGVCLPGAEDIAVPPRSITADNTCGNHQKAPPNPIQYCPLVQGQDCFSCNSSSNEFQHPARFMIDRSNGYSTSNLETWWQSGSWYEWLTYHNEDPLVVNITISFNKSYVLTGDIKVTFKFTKPAMMVIEKSTDFGQSWTPLQYFADNCLARFQMEHSPLNCSTSAVLCSQKYSDPNEGTLYFSFLDCYTRQTFWNRDNQDLLEATDLRLRLQFPATDGLYISKQQHNLQKYFYAISDIQVYGRCQCNGHAPNCEFPEDKNGGYLNIPTCLCTHHTEGVDCERCEPLYNNKTWMPATSMSEPNECQKCECHQHTPSCTFNSTLGHGVCDRCQHNTTGYFCEQCENKFYRNLSRHFNDPLVCLACNCATEGITNNGSCSQKVSTIGQCECKRNVTGRRCDRCEDAYYGYTLPSVGNCVACECAEYGTVNGSLNCHQVSGQCSCKNNTELRTCSQCKLGYYGFPKTTEGDCLQCVCDYGGSTPDICEKDQGTCLCRNGVHGETCSQVQENRFFPAYDYFLYEAEYQSGNYMVTSNVSEYGRKFTGRGYAELHNEGFINFDVSVKVKTNFSLVLRYLQASSGLGLTIKGRNVTGCPEVHQNITIDSLETDGSAYQLNDSVMLCPGTDYTFKVYDDSSMNFSIKVDSLLLIPQLTELRSYQYMPSFVNTCQGNVSTIAGILASRSECKNVTFSTMVEFFNGSLECGCSDVGANSSTCDPYGGQCRCKQGVMGRTCDRCQPGYYNFTKDGCTPCACHELGSQNFLCDEYSGKCLCKQSVEGRACDHCELHHYGLHTGQGCISCNCSATGSINQTCGDMTGRCYCKPGVEDVLTDKCDRCQENFFNFTQEGCQACRCNEAGSRSLQCHQRSGECPCKINTAGMKCNTCTNGTYSLEKTNPSGCIPCFCFSRSNQCSSAEGFILSSIKQNLTMAKYAKLSRRFQGYQLHSYVRLFEINFTKFLNISEVELRLKGVHYNASFRLAVTQCDTPEVGRYCTLLHEKYTLQSLTAYQMQSILADVKEVTVNMDGDVANVSEVSFAMGTAINGAHGNEASHVEKCECPGRYKELSCQDCNTGDPKKFHLPSLIKDGFTREIAHSNAFVNCALCFCNNRSETCDGETGVCDECRLSQGDYCEVCGYGVDITTGCTTCMPEFYTRDIHEHGCRACDCVMNNTLYHNSSVCNATSGQCTCKEYVSGRQCEHCAENYYNTTHGCRECPECYGLLKVHVHRLRNFIDEVDNTVEKLTKRFEAIQNHEFARRLSQAKTDVDNIYKKANLTAGRDPYNLNATSNVLDNLTLSIDQLMDQVGELNRQRHELQLLVGNISIWTQTAYASLHQANYSRIFVQNLTKTIASFVQPLERAKDTMEALNQDQQNIADNLTRVSKFQLEKITQLLFHLKIVDKNLNENTKGVDFLQNETHLSSNFAEITRNFSENIYDSAKVILDLSTNVLKTVRHLSDLIDENRNLTRRLHEKILIPTFNYQPINNNASILFKDSQKQTTEAATNLNNTQILLTEVKEIRDKAKQANESAIKTLKDAITTRKTLDNFQNTSTDATKMANESIQQISSIRAESERSIRQIQNVSKSVQDGLQLTDEAMNLANEAYDLVLAENQGISSVHNRSKILENHHQTTGCSREQMMSYRDNMTTRARVLTPLIGTCPLQAVKNTSEEAYETLRQSEEGKSETQESFNDVSDVYKHVTESETEVQRIENAVKSKTHETRVDSHTQMFEELRIELAKLRRAKDRRAEVIARMRERVRTMKLEIQDLESLRDSFKDIPPCRST